MLRRGIEQIVGLVGSAALVVLTGLGASASASAPAAAGDPVSGEVVFAFTDPRIGESSGLVMHDGLAVTANDSGDAQRIFTVDPGSGETIGVTRWDGEATDVEALAPAGPGEVWVGDIGDNDARRDSIDVARVPFGAGDRSVAAATHELTYPDGARDAETLLSDPSTGRLYLVSKEFRGQVFALPQTLQDSEPGVLEPVGAVLGFATDGAFAPDGHHLVLRNYGQLAVYTWPQLERIALLDLPDQAQGEAVAISEDAEVFVGSEGVGSEVLRLDLPATVAAVLAGRSDPSSQPVPSSPSESSSRSGERQPAEHETTRWPWPIGGVLGASLLVAALVAVLVTARRRTDRVR